MSEQFEKDVEWAANTIQHTLWLGKQYVYDMLKLRFGEPTPKEEHTYSKDDHIRDLQERNTNLVEENRRLLGQVGKLLKVFSTIRSIVHENDFSN